jgi:hypothetical protein
MLMKHFSTLDNDLTMILELLSDMVDSRHLSETQMMQIMENYFNLQAKEEQVVKPSENVVKNIMNYSHSLEVMRLKENQPVGFIVN